MSNNILIRNLSEFDQAILDELKEHFQEKTATQTIIKTLRTFRELKNKAELLDSLCLSPR